MLAARQRQESRGRWVDWWGEEDIGTAEWELRVGGGVCLMGSRELDHIGRDPSNGRVMAGIRTFKCLAMDSWK
jgi:hypothetical protein